jgi:Flp pilus assembly protein TadD
VQAKILARRGSLTEAVELGREAVSISARTDEPNNRADVLMSLGEILQLASRPDEAAEAIAEALSLYEQKENVAPAERARALLEELR